MTSPEPIGWVGFFFGLYVFATMLGTIAENHDKVLACLKDNGKPAYRQSPLYIDSFQRCDK